MKSAGISLLLLASVLATAQVKEFAAPYRDWLNEDVTYIITDAERSAFVRLQTDEERDQFIEQFWLRRDPTPDTIENEFREEHYRRIAYANERFASGIAGWKTDRGRIYIVYGPPDEIDDHSSGGGKTYPFQQWHYRYIEGVGTNVIIEFDDPTMSGEFHMTIDPADIKGRLLHVPDSSLTILEQMSFASRTQRLSGDDAQVAAPVTGPPEHESTPVQVVAPLKFPKTRFPDLEAKVDSRIIYFLWPMRVRVDFFPVTNATVLTYVTVQFENKDIQLKQQDGIAIAHLQMFGELRTLSGKVIQQFEDEQQIPAGPQEYRSYWAEQKSLLQKVVPLSPDTYRLDVVCRDPVSGGINNWSSKITVPSALSATSIILADSIEEVPMRNIATGEFVIGGSKVRPRIGGSFRRDESLGVYMKLYNLGIDDQTRKPQGQVEYQVLKAGANDVVTTTEDIAQIPDASGSEVTLRKTLRLENLSPGSYTLRVTITDNNGKQTLSESAPFTVT